MENHRASVIGLLLSLTMVVAASAQPMVSQYVRIKGQGDAVLQGLGLVVGLNGTGDQGDDLAIARPLAQLLRSMGNPIDTFQELANSRSAALVMVTCQVPRHGSAAGDNLDVRVPSGATTWTRPFY